MNKVVSCCGCVCSECSLFPHDCKGCSQIKGKVYWTQYTDKDVCDIYECCINKNTYSNCSACTELPCKYYNNSDPTKSKEENEEDLKRQLNQLRLMKNN